MLTEKQIKAMKPAEKEYTVSDGRSARGEGVLMLRVRPNGTKEFYFQRRVNGTKSKSKLGTWPALGLAAARDLCRVEKEAVVSPASFQDLLDSYVAKLQGEGAASADDVKWSFNRYVSQPFPNLVKKPVSLIGPGEIRDIIAKMIADGVTTYCNRLRSQLHAAFQVGLEQEFNPRSYQKDDLKFGIKSNPVASVPVQADWEQPGDRALSTNELAYLWQVLPEQLSVVTAELIKFLIASGGQRPEQLLATERRHYLKDHLIIRNKKGRGAEGERSLHVVPYNKLMRQSLKAMDEINETSAYPFEGKVVGTSLHTNSLSRAVTKLCSRHADKFNGPFTLRDLRRTCKTLMGVAKLSKELRDRIQGHAFGDVSSKHYDRYDYFDEKKNGLQKWATWLEKNVITAKLE
ncbi:tyrosine-type recombinase/integrase [Pseudomonas protegens]|uniref:tyrosine-type recombinase/integrase n=1 Tax=Pseudomonas protegens TaxID=380021 RepID=UPI001883E857|nr:integrase family protein [Pseudomonas protegens]MBF0638733.1 integrase family protein [Pseudomonas protegens]